MTKRQRAAKYDGADYIPVWVAALRYGCCSKTIVNKCNQKKLIYRRDEYGYRKINAASLNKFMNEQLERGYAG